MLIRSEAPLKKSYEKQVDVLNPTERRRIQVVVVAQADRFLTFISPTENDVLVPVLARSIDVVVVSFVVDLKLPTVGTGTTGIGMGEEMLEVENLLNW